MSTPKIPRPCSNPPVVSQSSGSGRRVLGSSACSSGGEMRHGSSGLSSDVPALAAGASWTGSRALGYRGPPHASAPCTGLLTDGGAGATGFCAASFTGALGERGHTAVGCCGRPYPEPCQRHLRRRNPQQSGQASPALTCHRRRTPELREVADAGAAGAPGITAVDDPGFASPADLPPYFRPGRAPAVRQVIRGGRPPIGLIKEMRHVRAATSPMRQPWHPGESCGPVSPADPAHPFTCRKPSATR